MGSRVKLSEEHAKVIRRALQVSEARRSTLEQETQKANDQRAYEAVEWLFIHGYIDESGIVDPVLLGPIAIAATR